LGILEQKSRFLDSVITQEGRRQIASGKLRAEFYSFSDAGAVYALSDTFISGTGDRTDDIATRFQFEAGNWNQDQVTFEANDAGGLVIKEFKSVDGKTLRVLDGQIFSGTIGTGSMQRLTSSAEFASLADGLLSSSITNYQNLYVLGSPDLFKDKNASFQLDRSNIDFVITDERPIPSQNKGGTQEANINHIESLFADKRLSHVPNFQFLPPVNKPKLGSSLTYPIGIFPIVGQRPMFEFSDVEREVEQATRNGFSEAVRFTFTSEQNRVFGQFFEVAGDKLTKLDVIDFGLFTVSGQEVQQNTLGGINNEQFLTNTKHVFFVGKVYVDDNGTHTFVNIFSLIFE